MELKELKKDYESLRKKYKLPAFSELNVDFEIEKLTDRETALENIKKIKDIL